MVYTGKPSRGCQMCKTRRIKVSDSFAGESFQSVWWEAFYMSLTCEEWSPFQDMPCQPGILFILTECSATRKDQHVATAGSQDGIARGTRTTSISCSAMRIKQWLARRRKPLARDHLEAVPGAQARIHLHICKLIESHSFVPTREYRIAPHTLPQVPACTRCWVCRSVQ